MPYSHFIPIKKIEGELLVSQKRNRLGFTLTTKELIFQKPHVSYQIFLSDTLGIVPFKLKKDPALLHIAADSGTLPRFSSQYYRISASRVFVVNRSGSYERGATDLLAPLNDRFIQHIQRHADFTAIPTR
ncbi:hypothetical protein [Salinithrix halophila]|uniref:PH (Pleckstrin Homology) domain-containing protein n=1 Tax=Salinithrix halophila TaxID=1485204 RepID=A0ABV8JIK8_9BACL